MKPLRTPAVTSLRRQLLVFAVSFVLVASGCVGAPSVPSPSESPAGPTGGEAASSGDVPDPDDVPLPGKGPNRTATVVDVVDGDTIKIAYPNGTRDTARLLGVDTPETYGESDPADFEGVPDTAAGRACLNDHGERASDYATEALLDREVTLRFDANEPRRGYYDRLLVYVVVDGVDLNYGLVAEGYARVYDSQFTARERYYDAESSAQRVQRGLWECATDDGGPPAETDGGSSETADGEDSSGTDASGDSLLVVAEIHEDAAGDDRQNLDDEYVVFRNAGDEALDLTGWTVTDEAGKEYRFPDGFVLGPGETVTLRTSDGVNTDETLYWEASGPVWNNDGDEVVVRDDAGVVVARRSY
ncbi:lamin tail domain-containing protein [Haloprofundus salilacus]|uniref:lamin tail domain-containing protein n=1 Tax=Haloprofundus salilacus TaxID=2876190 RepID=UPI001CCEA548|nr:lamin tail domain-containing protein [Haloprofundus salilacus]